MAAPGDKTAAGAVFRGHLRTSRADREQVVGILKAAFVQGRLTKDEFDLRIGRVLASRTYADLDALTADLPAELARPRPPGQAVQAQPRPPASRALLWGSWVIVLLTVGFMLGASVASWVLALVVGVFPLLIAAPIAGTLTIDSWRDTRHRGQLPPPPRRRGRALEGEHGSGAGDDLIASEDGPASPMLAGEANRSARWPVTRHPDRRQSVNLPVTA
jgi:Domain of unknown function (DUF1707)